MHLLLQHAGEIDPLQIHDDVEGGLQSADDPRYRDELIVVKHDRTFNNGAQLKICIGMQGKLQATFGEFADLILLRADPQRWTVDNRVPQPEMPALIV